MTVRAAGKIEARVYQPMTSAACEDRGDDMGTDIADIGGEPMPPMDVGEEDPWSSKDELSGRGAPALPAMLASLEMGNTPE
ncbi:hypothetical protein PHLCEN_2v582 [Hermanssonia centrifuga]|uniref:Uncharacterized protein n=1 Tax=Hermanssonia centrifuga TaxID=98765 RepID=A0A2R6S5M9_9APHY|nr:hypothetical protein PHLCEN_2v582 [Hermanssonia centrifuga]